MRQAGIAVAVWVMLCFGLCDAAVAQERISVFPLDQYDQSVDHWIKPGAPEYDTPVLPMAVQTAYLITLKARYFGADMDAPSPWNGAFITRILNQQGNNRLGAMEAARLRAYDNRGKSAAEAYYGQNLRPHTERWIEAIAANMNLAAMDARQQYQPAQRAIATDNMAVRGLPTTDPAFRDPHLPGEGYPFDDLQLTAVWAGTPLYVLSETADRTWLFVQTPDVTGWVPNKAVARVSDAFVQRWRDAGESALAAIIRPGVPVSDTRGHYRFKAYVGALFPVAASPRSNTLRLMVPIMRPDHSAVIGYADVSGKDATVMPLPMTPRNFAMLIKASKNRAYGWGNIGFYNDCSAELKGLFAPFGIWLQRNSAFQVEQGHVVDLSSETPAQRLQYLAKYGVPFLTLIRIPGHIMLYIGNDNRSSPPIPMTYQDIWGLSPADGSRRAVIGQSVIFPLLLHYPEDPGVSSLASHSIFELSYLGENPAPAPSGHAPVVPYDTLMQEAPF